MHSKLILLLALACQIAVNRMAEAQVQEPSGYRARLISETEVAPGMGEPGLVCSEMRNERICSACCNNNLYEVFYFNANQCYCQPNNLETHHMAENQSMDLKKLLAMHGLKV